MNRTSVSINILNISGQLSIMVRADRWQDDVIVEICILEDLMIEPIAEPSEAEFRPWASQVARTAARAVEDAFMRRVYSGTAAEPLEWKKNR